MMVGVILRITYIIGCEAFTVFYMLPTPVPPQNLEGETQHNHVLG